MGGSKFFPELFMCMSVEAAQ